MRPIAEQLANRGYTVELPLLPGHGTAITDLIPTRWEDWSGAAEAAYQDLAARCARVAVVGLSMGGGLTVWLAEHHPEITGIALVNPLVQPIDPELREAGLQLLDAGVEVIDGIGNDIAKDGVNELSYSSTPLAAAASLMDGLEGVAEDLTTISCPVLVLTSRQDHVVTTDNSELVADRVAGTVEHFWLERSYHVATLDFDADVIEAETIRFLETVFEGAA
jgi:carboxylesterase